MSVTDELLRNAEDYAAGFDKGDLPLPPAKQVAVVARMDARLDPQAVLGLSEGDAHVIRNADGVVTDDEIRSLAISQRTTPTRPDQGDHPDPPHRLRDAHVQGRRLPPSDPGRHRHQANRTRPPAEAFPDVEEDVRQSIARIEASPFVPLKDSIRGFVYEVETGKLREVPKAA